MKTTSIKAKTTKPKATSSKTIPKEDIKNQEKDTKDFEQQMQLASILHYYRQRVEAFEKDRQQWYEKLEFIRVKQDQVHRVEWELKKRQEEKAELERAIQQCQGALYIERDRLIKMKEDSDLMKIKGKENRQLILQLLEATNSVEQHVFYQKDAAPETIQSYSKKTLGKVLGPGGNSKTIKDQIESHKKNPAIHYDYKQPNVLKTIYLPNDQLGKVKQEVEQLHIQIQEQRLEYEMILGKLRDEKAKFEEQQRIKYLDYVEEIETLIKKLQDQETLNYQIVKDHVDLLAQYEIEERKMQEEIEAIRVENVGLREQINQIANKTVSKKKEAKSEYEKNVAEFQERFREQSRVQKENITIIKDQYKKVQEIYKKKMEDMNERLEKETKKMKIAERRRKLELEGYTSDLMAMKKQLRSYQNYILNLKRLAEDDQPELLQGIQEEENDIEDGEDQLGEEEENSPEK